MVWPDALEDLHLLEWTIGQKITVSADHVEGSIGEEGIGIVGLES